MFQIIKEKNLLEKLILFKSTNKCPRTGNLE